MLGQVYIGIPLTPYLFHSPPVTPSVVSFFKLFKTFPPQQKISACSTIFPPHPRPPFSHPHCPLSPRPFHPEASLRHLPGAYFLIVALDESIHPVDGYSSLHLSHEGLQTCTKELHRALRAIYHIFRYSADVDALILRMHALETELGKGTEETGKRVTVEKAEDGADGAAV
jgi:hypothetical protein